MIRNGKGDSLILETANIIISILAIMSCMVVYTQAAKARVDATHKASDIRNIYSVLTVLEYDVHSTVAVDILDDGYTLHLGFSGGNDVMYYLKDESLFRNNERLCKATEKSLFGVEGGQVVVSIDTGYGYKVDAKYYSTMTND